MSSEQAFRAQPGPVAGAVADAAVDPLAGEVDQPRGRRELDLELRVQRLEAPDAASQPLRSERRCGADGERTPAPLAQGSDTALERREGVADRRQQELTFVRQHQPSVQAAEQRHPQVLLQRLDLVADGGLGDEQLLGSLGEAEVPRGGLEGPERVQRGQAHRFTSHEPISFVR